MRSLEEVLVHYDQCFYKKGKFGHRGRCALRESDVRTQGEDGHMTEEILPMNQQMPRITNKHQKPEVKGRLSPKTFKSMTLMILLFPGPLVPHFQLPGLWDNEFLGFLATQFFVLCYGNLSKLIKSVCKYSNGSLFLALHFMSI